MHEDKPSVRPFIEANLTPFQRRVYEKLTEVPRGNVTTYKALAHAIGSKAYHAVGSALNKNPFAPRVPCHRVVNSDGSIGGFAHGPEEKKRILQSEGISFRGDLIGDFESHRHLFSLFPTNNSKNRLTFERSEED